MSAWTNTIEGLALDLAKARPEWPIGIIKQRLQQRHSNGTGIALLAAIVADIAARPNLERPAIIDTHTPKIGHTAPPTSNTSPRAFRCKTCGRQDHICYCNACPHGENRGSDYCPFCRTGTHPRTDLVDA